MSEYINKQEAIEAFSDMSDGIPITHGDMISDTAAVNVITSLPSAFEGMTNGEVIQALFPSVRVNERNVELLGGLDGFSHRFNKDWWNAPYKAESEEAK